jgi:glutamate--cysteine ligase
MFTRTDFSHLSTFFIAQEAIKRGYVVEKLFPKTNRSELKITNSDGQETFVIGQRAANLPYNAYFICKYKNVTKKFLSDNNISISKGKAFTPDKTAEALKYFDSILKPVVIKPTQGTWGCDVFLNITDKKQAQKIIKKLTNRNATFLIEEQSVGDEYRILATCNEVLGIIHRIPANVIGDGIHTIEELVKEKNADKRRTDDHGSALVTIQLDDIALNILNAQNLTIKSIPAKKDRILLRDNSNISTGGDSIDYTDIAHPKVKELAIQIIKAIPGLPYAGFDFLTPDITKDPSDVGYTVIEINDSPMISMHHEPYEGKKRNVSAKIVDLLFI